MGVIMSNRRIIAFLVIAVLWSIGTMEFLSYVENLGFEDLWIKLLIISLLYGLPMFFLFMKVNKNHTLSNKQISGLFLLVLALPIFGYAFLGTRIPTIESSNLYVDFVTVTKPSGNVTVSFSTIMDFTAVGSFSAENPIHAKITVFDANVTDFLDYIGIVSFTGSNPVSSGNSINVVSRVGYFNLTQVSAGRYEADGYLIWYQSINSHSAWLAPNTKFFDQNFWQQKGNAKINISPAADTLAFRSSYTMEQLTYVLVGFSVVMLQPILEALFPDKQRIQQTQTSQNQREPHHKGKH
jgi:hypothetical protein